MQEKSKIIQLFLQTYVNDPGRKKEEKETENNCAHSSGRRRQPQCRLRRIPYDHSCFIAIDATSQFDIEEEFGEEVGLKGTHKVVRVNMVRFQRDVKEELKREVALQFSSEAFGFYA